MCIPLSPLLVLLHDLLFLCKLGKFPLSHTSPTIHLSMLAGATTMALSEGDQTKKLDILFKLCMCVCVCGGSV